MEQHYLSEGEEEHGCQVPVAGAEGGLTLEAALSSEQEKNAPAAEIIGGCHGAAVSESDVEDTAEALTEESEVIAPVTVGNAGQGDVSSFGCSKNEYHDVPKENHPATTRYELRGLRPARRAIAHAMPPSTYRRLPLRSRKPSNPTRFIVVGDAASGVAHAYDHGTSSEEVSGPPTSAMVSAAHGDNDEAIDSTRSRKQKRRWDHFISDPDEAVSADRAKAHRSETALDRFLTSSVVASPPEERPGWVRRNEAFRAASGGDPEEPDGSGRRILAIVAILGASLALSVVSCVLIYIAGQQTASGACDTHRKK